MSSRTQRLAKLAKLEPFIQNGENSPEKMVKWAEIKDLEKSLLSVLQSIGNLKIEEREQLKKDLGYHSMSGGYWGYAINVIEFLEGKGVYYTGER